MPALAAGFWVRWAATWIDALLAYVAATALVAIAARGGRYLPFELTLLVAWLAHSVLLVALRGQTAGKAWCGLSVRSRNGGRIGFRRTLFREFAGKLVSGVFFLAGFVWVAISRHKLAWHDYLAGTAVVRDPTARRRAGVGWLVGLAISLAVTGLLAGEAMRAGLLMAQMNSGASETAAYLKRDAADAREVSSLNEENRAQLNEWLDQNGKDPLEYAVEAAARHEVVIFGEFHGQRPELMFLNELIPEAYRRAGVTCVALEVCLARDNSAIQRLVTAPHFDRQSALEIARRQLWGTWGWKEHWDVLETVWQLNRSLPAGSKKVRVVGLDQPIDLQSIGMLQLGDNPATDCPLWEKLRVFRLVRALPRVLARDAFMARQVELEIIEKGERGIVWVGRNHSPIHCPQIGPGRSATNRMGFLLGRRLGNRVFQIRLHGYDLPAPVVDAGAAAPPPQMGEFLESVMRQRRDAPVGFSVANSPFALLRDAGSFEYHAEPRLVLADVASGYVFLCARRDLSSCQWLDGYVSEEMFVANKPFYQAFGRRAGRQLRSAADVNALLRQ